MSLHLAAGPQRQAYARDAFRPFPDHLSALLTGPSATAAHVKYTFLFLANFVQARLLRLCWEKAGLYSM